MVKGITVEAHGKIRLELVDISGEVFVRFPVNALNLRQLGLPLNAKGQGLVKIEFVEIPVRVDGTRGCFFMADNEGAFFTLSTLFRIL